jgi:hypothetical protein
MLVKFVIEVFFSSIRAKATYSIVFMFIMLLKVFKNIKRVWFDTKHVNYWSLNKSHKNVTKYLTLSLNTKNWTRSLHTRFKKCLSKITKLLCDLTFCLIMMHNSHEFLFAMNLIKFISFDILTNRRTFYFFKCFNRACHIFKIFLLIEKSLTNDLTKLSTINVMIKL